MKADTGKKREGGTEWIQSLTRSEIETAAVKIMNESALQKKELDEESKQRMDAYDADVDKKTEAKLADIRASLENQKKAELSS